MNFRIMVGPYILSVSFLIRKTVNVRGTYSLCSDGNHVVYLDYDDMDIEAVGLEIRNLQRMYDLSDFYLFRSSEGSYHAVCLDKVSAEEYENMISASNCDPDFKRYNRYNRMGSRVLRISPKKGDDIKFLYHLPCSNYHRQRSEAHRLLLNTNYRLDIDGGDKYDGSTKLYICQYRTGRTLL